MTYEFGIQDLAGATATTSLNQGELNKKNTESTYSASGEGIHIVYKLNNRLIFESKVQVSSSGALVQLLKNEPATHYQAVILNSATRLGDPAMADRYSSLLKQGRADRLSQFLYLVHPEIKGISILTMGGMPILHADIGNNNWIPLSFLGEGATCLAGAILAIADCQNGIVLLDEIDATVHHSTLDSMWKLIVEASKTFNTQVFTTTHSEKSLEALAHAVTAGKLEGDITYSRLRRTKSGTIAAVQYDGTQLTSALSQAWEVR